MNFFRLLILFTLCCGAARGKDYDVRDFGAKADGRTLATRAIQAAVEACAASGGGRVVLCGGDYLSGTIFMRDDVALRIERGARLLGSTDTADYPHQKLDFRFYGDTWASQSLVFAHNVRNIAIEGDGTIDGQGGAFKQTTTKKPDRYRNRPYLLWIAGCTGVKVSGLELRSSAMWMQSYLRCDELRIEDLRIYNHANYNNDLIDIDGCRNVIVRGIVGDADDDGLTLKSTCGRIGENIVISDCILSSHCNALKFGTESTAGFRNVTVSNIVIRPSSHPTVMYGLPGGTSGISLEIVDGGVMERVAISNVVIEGPAVPLFIRLGNRARKHYDGAPQPGMGRMKDISISGVVARAGSNTGCAITGVPGVVIEGLSIQNCRFSFPGGGTAEDASRQISELADLYPEATMFGTLPAYGFYIRHAKDVVLQNINFELTSQDARPAVLLDDAEGFESSGITPAGAQIFTKTTRTR